MTRLMAEKIQQTLDEYHSKLPMKKRNKPLRLLDLYCCAGGAGVGYYRAGFDEVVGVDHIGKKQYPFKQIKADILKFIKETPIEWFRKFHLIHASPPCQKFTRCTHLAIAQGNKPSKVDHITPIRKFLKRVGVPFVIENVEGSPLKGTVLCGSSFGLGVQRHRLFESTFPISRPPCDHNTKSWPMGPKGRRRPIGVYGSMGDQVKGFDKKNPERGEIMGGVTAKDAPEAMNAMGIDWCNQWNNLKEAVPPKYTEHIAQCFFEHYP